jgi:UDPglucose 6-dehydrogenase
MEIVSAMLEKEANIMAYDPKAMKNAALLLGDKIGYADNMYQALKDADILVILTEWKEFKSLDLEQVADLMNGKRIFDCRNLINKEKAISLGFEYQGIGQ